MRPLIIGATIVALWATGPAATVAQQATAGAPVAELTYGEIERFLRDAKVIRTQGIRKGVTGSIRATLSDGVLTHDAQIQTVEERKTRFESRRGSEFNFEDSWRFNVAAYRLARLLDLRMVPVSVRRSWRTQPAAFTWWIDDVLMDEAQRLEEGVQPPDSATWNEQLQMVRLFDQLIDNVDRNMGNLLIGRDWRLWAIDHTRAFRTHDTLRKPADVRQCDRQVRDRLEQLDRATLQRALGDVLSGYQISGLLARRDRILQILAKAGPGVLFDRRPVAGPLSIGPAHRLHFQFLTYVADTSAGGFGVAGGSFLRHP